MFHVNVYDSIYYSFGLEIGIETSFYQFEIVLLELEDVEEETLWWFFEIWLFVVLNPTQIALLQDSTWAEAAAAALITQIIFLLML